MAETMARAARIKFLVMMKGEGGWLGAATGKDKRQASGTLLIGYKSVGVTLITACIVWRG